MRTITISPENAAGIEAMGIENAGIAAVRADFDGIVSGCNSELRILLAAPFLSSDDGTATVIQVNNWLFNTMDMQQGVDGRHSPFKTRNRLRRLADNGLYTQQDGDSFLITDKGRVASGIGGLLLRSGYANNVSIMPVVGYTSFAERQKSISSNLTTFLTLNRRPSWVNLGEIIMNGEKLGITASQIQTNVRKLASRNILDTRDVKAVPRFRKSGLDVRLSRRDPKETGTFYVDFIEDYLEVVRALLSGDESLPARGITAMNEVIVKSREKKDAGLLAKRGLLAANRHGKTPVYGLVPSTLDEAL